jgi:hypothetical protein
MPVGHGPGRAVIGGLQSWGLVGLWSGGRWSGWAGSQWFRDLVSLHSRGLAGPPVGSLVEWWPRGLGEWGLCGPVGLRLIGHQLAVLLVNLSLEKSSMSYMFRVPIFWLSLVLYLSQGCLQYLRKVPDSWSSPSLQLCPSHHLGSLRTDFNEINFNSLILGYSWNVYWNSNNYSSQTFSGNSHLFEKRCENFVKTNCYNNKTINYIMCLPLLMQYSI